MNVNQWILLCGIQCQVRRPYPNLASPSRSGPRNCCSCCLLILFPWTLRSRNPFLALLWTHIHPARKKSSQFFNSKLNSKEDSARNPEAHHSLVGDIGSSVAALKVFEANLYGRNTLLASTEWSFEDWTFDLSTKAWSQVPLRTCLDVIDIKEDFSRLHAYLGRSSVKSGTEYPK